MKHLVSAMGHDNRANPLRKWLRKNVGRNWNAIYSEFCENIDRRTFSGFRMHRNLWQLVETWESWKNRLDKHPSWRADGFFIDKANILQKGEVKIKATPDPDPDHFDFQGNSFERINDCWFVCWGEVNDGEYSHKRQQLSSQELKDLNIRNGPGFKWWKDNG